MPMDLYRSGDHYVLHADLPGIDPGSIDLSVDGGNLTIRAERSARPDEAVQWMASERFSGRYMRQLSLGDDVDSSQIRAAYHNGVLTVSIPVAERASRAASRCRQTTIRPSSRAARRATAEAGSHWGDAGRRSGGDRRRSGWLRLRSGRLGRLRRRRERRPRIGARLGGRGGRRRRSRRRRLLAVADRIAGVGSGCPAHTHDDRHDRQRDAHNREHALRPAARWAAKAVSPAGVGAFRRRDGCRRATWPGQQRAAAQQRPSPPPHGPDHASACWSLGPRRLLLRPRTSCVVASA